LLIGTSRVHYRTFVFVVEKRREVDRTGTRNTQKAAIAASRWVVIALVLGIRRQGLAVAHP
jgi:hypothetical protein